MSNTIGYVLIGVMSFALGGLYAATFYPKLLCLVFGHSYPLVDMWSVISAALCDPQQAAEEAALLRHTCLRCGELDTKRYEEEVERHRTRRAEINETKGGNV